MVEEKIRKYWEDYKQKYGNISHSDFCLNYFPWSFWQPAKKRLNLLLEHTPGDGKILDAGCGNGWATVALIKKGFDVTSVDLSPRSIENIKKLADVTNTKINLIKCDLVDLPFEDGYFKTVFSFEVLEHIQNLEKATNELKRVLSPEGLLILSLPNKYGSFSLLEDFLVEKIIKQGKSGRGIEEHHINLHTIYWWKEYFQEHGFEVLKLFNIEYFSPLLAFLGRENISLTAKLDTKIGDWLPSFFASGWLFVLKKI